MKWLNLKEFGLNIGFRLPTQYRDKLAVVELENVKLLEKYLPREILKDKMNEIGFLEVNSETGNPKFVKADNKIQPSLFRTFLPINNNHLIEMQEKDAISRLYVDKDGWLALTGKQSKVSEYWTVDFEAYESAIGLAKNSDIKQTILDFLKTQRNTNYIDLSFENPIPVKMLQKYGYDSRIFGILALNKDKIIELGVPEAAIKKEKLTFTLPIIALKNNCFLTINNIKEIPELLEYPASNWNEALKTQQAYTDLNNIFSKINNLQAKTSQSEIKELAEELHFFIEEKYKNILNYTISTENTLNELLKPSNDSNDHRRILEEIRFHIERLDINNDVSKEKLETSLFEFNSAPDPEPEQATEPTPEPEQATEPKPEPEQATEPKPEPEQATEPKPEPEQATEPKPEISKESKGLLDLDLDGSESTEPKLKKNNDRIEDYGEEVLGARKHLYHSVDILKQIDINSESPIEFLIDKFKKQNLWNFKKETLPSLKEKSNELFFVCDAIYNLLPNKFSESKRGNANVNEQISQLKNYSIFISHIKEIINDAVDHEKKHPIANIMNSLSNYKYALNGEAKNPIQIEFEELNNDFENADLKRDINNQIYGRNRKPSKFYYALNDIAYMRSELFSYLIKDELKAEKISTFNLRNFIKSGGVDKYDALKNIDKILMYSDLEATYKISELKLGSQEFLKMLVLGGKVEEILQKTIKNSIGSEIFPLIKISNEDILEYKLQVYRSIKDSEYEIDNRFKIEVKQNQEKELDHKLSQDQRHVFDQTLRKILKEQQPDKLDLRYPEILQNIAHKQSIKLRTEDITVEKFGEVFGFRAVQFGNWVTQKERQELINIAFDGLVEMKEALNISFKDISFDGTLAIAFGARGQSGRGAAAAHYEPYDKIFNLTKQNGAGTLSHEWHHALDDYAARKMSDLTSKLIYLSGSKNNVDKGYFLSELMADVDYKQSKNIIESNPVLKSFYELQLKLNGKMTKDEIFTQEGKELIATRSNEIVSSKFDALEKMRSNVIASLKETGNNSVVDEIQKIISNSINKLKEFDGNEPIPESNNELFVRDLRLNRSNTIQLFRKVNSSLRENNIPIGKYTILNPITRVYNDIYGDNVQYSEHESCLDLLNHLRNHKYLKELEAEINSTAVHIIQKKYMPIAINQLNIMAGSNENHLKDKGIKQFLEVINNIYKISNTKTQAFNLDFVFNKNNFSSQAKLLDNEKKKYWSLTCEKFARCGEAFLTDSFKEKNVEMGYIVQCMDDPNTMGRRSGITPSGQDRKEILECYRTAYKALRDHVFINELDRSHTNENIVTMEIK